MTCPLTQALLCGKWCLLSLISVNKVDFNTQTTVKKVLGSGQVLLNMSPPFDSEGGLGQEVRKPSLPKDRLNNFVPHAPLFCLQIEFCTMLWSDNATISRFLAIFPLTDFTGYRAYWVKSSGECSANLAMCLSAFKIEHALFTLGEYLQHSLTGQNFRWFFIC